MLFKPDSKDEADFDADQAVKEAYETVNEGDTTDTTSGLDGESLEVRALGTTRKSMEAKSEQKSSKAVEEGIKSSDEEEPETAEPA